MVALVGAIACWPLAARAVPVTLPTNTGMRTFDSEQFAASVIGSQLSNLSVTFQGPFPSTFGTISLGEAVFGADLTNGVVINQHDFVTLGFSQPGPQVAIWEAGALSVLAPTRIEASSDGGVTFGQTAVLFQPVPAVPDPKPSGYETNFQEFGATAFGLPAGALINALRITVDEGQFPRITAQILAVAVVPEPSSVALVALGLVGLGLARRSRLLGRAARPSRSSGS